MLTRKQLEDLKVCNENKDCKTCSCYSICMNVDSNAAETALALADMLKRLEWSRRSTFLMNGEYENHCPVCGRHKREGHSADCELSALLKELEGEK